MKNCFCLLSGLLVIGLSLLSPFAVGAETVPAKAVTNPPISQPLVREGAFAVKLEFELAVGTTEDEVEAESALAEIGILPRNGWIADYPVTPDVAGELRTAVAAAVESGKLPLAKEEALKRFEKVAADQGLAVIPYSGDRLPAESPEKAESYPNPAVINNYYTSEGPPVVTYYAPPPDYYYLYSWVPYPFWWTGFWFPGFFVLNDFHRSVFIGNRVVFVSNHFNDIRRHRVFRIDPVNRFHGRTFAGIGASGRRGFLSTGVPRGERRIFNEHRTSQFPGARSAAPPVHRGAAISTSRGGGRSVAAPPRPERRGGESRGGMVRRDGSPRGGAGGQAAPRQGGGNSRGGSRERGGGR